MTLTTILLTAMVLSLMVSVGMTPLSYLLPVRISPRMGVVMHAGQG